MKEPHPLIRIAQFGMIKVAPGLVNLALIPVLHENMGGGPFGDFSLILGYALLTITVLGSVITQPMYRFLKSDWQSLGSFMGFAMIAAGLGAVVTIALAAIFEAAFRQALISGAFVGSAILYTTLNVKYQVESRIKWLVTLETVRIAILAGAIFMRVLMGDAIDIVYALAAFWLSYLLPVLLCLRDLKLIFPSIEWIREKLNFGAIAAIWLVLAGLPLPLSKTYLQTYVGDVEFGAFSANIDMYYRAFSMINVAIAMWAFPAMSAKYDAEDYAEATRLQLFSGGVYIAGGIIVSAVVCIVAASFEQFPATMQGGLLPFAGVVVACFLWQGMSIAHKPLEMSKRLLTMVGVMLVAFLVFVITANLVLRAEYLEPSLAISLALIIASLVYLIGTLSAHLRHKRG